MNPQDLMEVTEYRLGKKSSTLRFSDTREVIVTWPNAIAPVTHYEACEQGLALSRQARGGAR